MQLILDIFYYNIWKKEAYKLELRQSYAPKFQILAEDEFVIAAHIYGNLRPFFKAPLQHGSDKGGFQYTFESPPRSGWAPSRDRSPSQPGSPSWPREDLQFHIHFFHLRPQFLQHDIGNFLDVFFVEGV